MDTINCIFLLAFGAVTSGLEAPNKLLFHQGTSTLTAKTFSEVAKVNPDKSFIFSAYSLWTPLAQLGLASVEDAQQELMQAIGVPDASTAKEISLQYGGELDATKGVTLKSASKIFVSENYELNSQFAADSRKYFKSEVQKLNFQEQQEAAKKVNTWVEEQTNSRIKDLVDASSLTPDTRVLLVNALYFKGTWDKQFNKMRSFESTFHKKDNVQNKVAMMFRKGEYNYAESEELKSQIIEIPYEGKEASLIVVLPREVEGIKEVEEILKDPVVLDNALNQLQAAEVELTLPKFKIETSTDLKDILEKINVTKAFSPLTAKLYNLVEDGGNNFYVDHATQKAFIEVNEEGAEAAAANEFGIFPLASFDFITMYTFVADHPFVFYLRANNVNIFSGVFYN